MQEARLVCVSKDNNNKWYNMKEDGNGTFTATWGRVGNPHVDTKTYPMSKWSSTIRSKCRASKKPYPYKDVTFLKVESTPTTSYDDLKCKKSQKLLDVLQGYSSRAIKTNYTVSSEGVTRVQIDKAQEIIDNMTAFIMPKKSLTKKLVSDFNDMCTELYTTIPRKMRKVQEFLIEDKNSAVPDSRKLIGVEQDLLDVMSQQVSMSKVSGPKSTMSKALGIDLRLATESEIKKIKRLMGGSKERFKMAYAVMNMVTQPLFDKRIQKSFSKDSKLLWHGSRNENWLNIVKTGLLIRPSGVITTGAMFGNGIYMADKARKSIGYTSTRGSYWVGGNSTQGFLALYDVNTGTEYQTKKHTSAHYSMDMKKLKSYGDYDSFFAEGGMDLRNNEYIIYDKNQCTVRYLIEIV